MTSEGVIFKRCGLEESCPCLGERGHGRWYFESAACSPN
jgi:hypothetical protein